MSVTVPTAAESDARHLEVVGRLTALEARVTALEARQPTPTPTPTPQPAGRITRDGTSLMLGGRRFRWAGVNWEHAVGCGLPGSQPTDAQAETFFRDLGPPRVTRVWAMPGISNQWEANLARVVRAAGKYGQYLAITLFNGQPDCTNGQIVDYSTGPQGSLPARTTDWIRAVVTPYATNPTAAIWEIANEPNEGDGNIGNWNAAVADAILGLAPDALVATGGGNNTGTVDGVLRLCKHPEIIPTLHDYYKPFGAMSPRAKPFNEAAKRLGRCWYVGEQGACCGGGDLGDQAKNAVQLVKLYDNYFTDPVADVCAGVCYWNYRQVQPETSTARPGSPLYRAICDYRVRT